MADQDWGPIERSHELAPTSRAAGWREHLAWAPPALFLALIAVFRLLPTIIVPPHYNFILPWLNFLLTTCVSLTVAALMARSFVRGSSNAALWMGSGLVMLGLASLLSGLKLLGGKADSGIATYNIAACMCGLCQVLGAALAFSPETVRPLRRAGLKLILVYGLGVGVVAAVSVLSLLGLLPDFWRAGGSTRVRDVVLGLAMGEFLLAAAMVRMLHRSVGGRFLHGYSLGLALLGVGLLGVLMLRDLNSALAWAGRSAQYAGGLYLLWAVMSLLRAGRWELPLERQLHEAAHQARLLARLPEENPAPVLRFSADGKLLYANPAARAYPEWALGPGQPGPDTLARLVDKALERAQMVEEEIRLGGRVLLVTAWPVVDERYVNVYARDITDRTQAEQALRESEDRLRTLTRAGFEGIAITCDDVIIEANPQFARMHGCSLEEVIGQPPTKFLHPDEHERVALVMAAAAESIAEFRGLRKDGSEIVVEAHGQTTTWRGRQVRFTALNDITARKRADEAIHRQNAVLAGINCILEMGLGGQSEHELCRACLAIVEELTGSRISFINELRPDGTLMDLAISNPGWHACDMSDSGGHRRPPGIFAIHGIYGRVVHDNRSLIVNDPASHPDRIGLPAGHPPLDNFLGVPMRRGGKIAGLIAVGNRPGGYGADHQQVLEALAPAIVETLDRKRAQEALRQSEERFRLFMDNSPTIAWVKDEQGRYVYLSRPDAQFGLRPEDWLGKTDAEVWPAETAQAFRRNDQAVLDSDKPMEVVEETRDAGGQRSFWLNSRFPFRDLAGKRYVAGIGLNITDRKQAEEALRRTAEELKRSNQDLEQFAYIASHDLQEPLRMVRGFMDRLQARCADALDDKAREYIGYAVDGAARMSALISDLLEYSRVQNKKQEPVSVDMNQAAQAAIANCQASIQETGAQVTREDLPVVVGDRLHLGLLLQNLVGNALKFRRMDVAPAVHLAARREGGQWVFRVQDNGIGIAPQHCGRLFQIFQRLHTRQEYPGTGIGLAICKKIVERHGGRIWIESQPGQGAAFLFSLPADETLTL